MRAALLLLATAVGCGDDAVLRLVFRATEGVNTEPQVAEAIERIEIHVGSPDGLRGAAAPGPSGGGALEDRDDDGRLEWIAVIEVRGELPAAEIRAGASAGDSIDVAAYGLAGAALAASGAVAGIPLAEETTTEVVVPIDLLPEFRPPRVTAVVPAYGDPLPCQAASGMADPAPVGAVRVLFSEEIDLDTINPFRVEGVRLGVEFVTPSGGRIVPQLFVASGGGLLFQLPAEALRPGAYVVTASPSVRDLTATPLDQDPEAPGLDPFVSTFVAPDCLAE